MFINTTNSENYQMIQLTMEELYNKEEDFNEKFDQALKDGVFYVKIPNKLKKQIELAKEFGNNLRTNDDLKKLNLGEQKGYQERFETQAVSFVSSKDQWEDVFSEPIKNLAIAMDGIARDILKASLKHLSVPEKLWSLATGELTDGKGSDVFSFNHYEPGNQKIGLIPHKDMGWITVLFIDKMGLETSKDGKNWTSVPPKEGYFVINFGRAFELLINSTDRLRASLHRVHRLTEKRLSFGIFINHNEGTNIYQLKEDENLKQIGTYKQYLEQCFSEFQELQKEQKE